MNDRRQENYEETDYLIYSKLGGIKLSFSNSQLSEFFALSWCRHYFLPMQPSRSLHLAAIRQARQVLQVQLDRRGGTDSTSSRRWSKRRRRPWSTSRWVIVLHFGTAVNFGLPCMPHLCFFKQHISPGSPPNVAFLAEYADRTIVGWHVFCFFV